MQSGGHGGGSGAHPCSMKTFVDDLRPLADSAGIIVEKPNDRSGGAGGLLEKIASTARVGSIEFAMLRSKEIEKMSHVQVASKSLYEMNRMEPQPYGCLDRRMGISSKNRVCLTCFKQLSDCIGHFGHVDLELPVFHIGYIKETIRVLQMICKCCSRVLLPPVARARFLKVMNRLEDRKARSAQENVRRHARAQMRAGTSVAATPL